jgi:predicted amidohydrolase YtcJ
LSRVTLFRGGTVFDGHRYLGRADVVVRAGRVAAVGQDLDTSATEVVEVVGLLAPGFTDAHVHPIQGGLERLRCDLSEHSTPLPLLAGAARLR